MHTRRRSLRWGGLAACALTALALLAQRARPASAPHVSERSDDPAWMGAQRIVSNGDGYVVRLRPSVEPIPQNESFGLEVWVFEAGREEVPLADVELSIDAGMPEHGHGMNRVPRVTARADGGFEVRDMLFHMGGHWELYVDVTRGPLTERAQSAVELE